MSRLAEIERELRVAAGPEDVRRLIIERTRLELYGPVEEPQEPRWIRFAEEVDAFVGRRIRAARGLAGLTQKRLADTVGLTQTQLSRVERGLRPLAVAEVIRLAIQLRRPVSFFVEPPDPEVVRTGWEPVPGDP